MRGVWKDALTARDRNADGELVALTDSDAPASLWYMTAEDGTVTWTTIDQSADDDYTQVDRVLVEAVTAVAEIPNDDPLTQIVEPAIPAVVEVPGNADNFDPMKYLEGLQAIADLETTDDAVEKRYEAIIVKVNAAALEAARATETARIAEAQKALDAAQKVYDTAKKARADDMAKKAKEFAASNAALVKKLIDDGFLSKDYADADLTDLSDKEAKAIKTAELAMARSTTVVGGNVKVERDAWMVSGKIKFGGPVDFRFSYMDADDLEVSCKYCTGDWDETAAEAWNVGLFYTMPAGTELRLTYSEVDNDENGTYGQGISGTGLGTAGEEIEMFAVGIVHWFD